MNLSPEPSMRVGLAKIEFHIPYCQSLKEKRHIVLKLKDRIWADFKVAIHEVGYQDKWQRASLGLAVVGTDAKVISGVINRVLHKIETDGLGEIVESATEIISF